MMAKAIIEIAVTVPIFFDFNQNIGPAQIMAIKTERMKGTTIGCADFKPAMMTMIEAPETRMLVEGFVVFCLLMIGA